MITETVLRQVLTEFGGAMIGAVFVFGLGAWMMMMILRCVVELIEYCGWWVLDRVRARRVERGVVKCSAEQSQDRDGEIVCYCYGAGRNDSERRACTAAEAALCHAYNSDPDDDDEPYCIGCGGGVYCTWDLVDRCPGFLAPDDVAPEKEVLAL